MGLLANGIFTTVELNQQPAINISSAAVGWAGSKDFSEGVKIIRDGISSFPMEVMIWILWANYTWITYSSSSSAFNLIKNTVRHRRAKWWKVAVGLWLDSRRESLYYRLCSALCSLSHIVATVNTFAFFFIFGVRPPAVMWHTPYMYWLTFI